MTSPGTFARLALAITLGAGLGACTTYGQSDVGARATAPAPYPAAVSTPAMQPDRQTDRPRSFSDPGPMYPDTGR